MESNRLSDEAYWQAWQPHHRTTQDYPKASPASQAETEHLWQQAQQAMESGEPQEATVVGYNRGGLMVEWQGLRGFVPASHLVCLSPFLDAEERRLELARRVGQVMSLRLIEMDRAQHRLIFSERVALSNEARENALLAQLTPGQVRQGVVTNVCSFGAFVDLGGLEGLIHISEISWGRVNHPRDVLESGQQVQVYVISVDPEQKRVALSLKRLQPDPWAGVEQRYRVGQTVKGQVTNVVSFGAFVRVEDGLEGLIHISELAEGVFLHPRNVVREGDTVMAHILNIDGAQRRMGLSLRRRRVESLRPLPYEG